MDKQIYNYWKDDYNYSKKAMAKDIFQKQFEWTLWAVLVEC